MKLLHTSDWHLGVSLYEYSLLEDQAHFLRWLTCLIREEAVNAVLISGDIYDRPIPPGDAIRLYDEFLNETTLRMGIPVLAIAGNHDSPARLGFAGELLRSAGYYIAGPPNGEIQRVELADEHGPVHIYLLPWLFPADVRTLLPESGTRTFDSAYRALLDYNRPRLDKNARNIILSHGFFAGRGQTPQSSDSEVQVGGMDLTGSDVFSGFDYVALGHLHGAQRAGDEHIRYSGSPLKYSLSEEGNRKSVTIVEFGDSHTPTVREVPVPALRDVRTVTGAFAELMEPSFHANKNFGDYVSARILGPGEYYAMDKLRTLFPNLLKLSFAGEEGQADFSPELPAERERLTMEDEFGRFYSYIKGEELTPEQMEILQEMISRAGQQKAEQSK